MKTPNDFIEWQQQLLEDGQLAMTKEECEILADMMADEDIYDDVEYSLDGLGIRPNGDVVYTNKDEIRYQQVIRDQRQKKHKMEKFSVISGENTFKGKRANLTLIEGGKDD
jgi:hypothetical protein